MFSVIHESFQSSMKVFSYTVFLKYHDFATLARLSCFCGQDNILWITVLFTLPKSHKNFHRKWLVICKAAFTLIHLTNMANFAIYIFQVFTLILQLCFHCDSSFIFISIHFDICIHFYPFWVGVFAYQCKQKPYPNTKFSVFMINLEQCKCSLKPTFSGKVWYFLLFP